MLYLAIKVGKNIIVKMDANFWRFILQKNDFLMNNNNILEY